MRSTTCPFTNLRRTSVTARNVKSKSIALYRKVFCEKYNLSFHKPKKDQCNKKKCKAQVYHPISQQCFVRSTTCPFTNLRRTSVTARNVKPKSIALYRKVFCEKYNLSFHKPKKDQCNKKKCKAQVYHPISQMKLDSDEEGGVHVSAGVSSTIDVPGLGTMYKSTLVAQLTVQ